MSMTITIPAPKRIKIEAPELGEGKVLWVAPYTFSEYTGPGRTINNYNTPEQEVSLKILITKCFLDEQGQQPAFDPAHWREFQAHMPLVVRVAFAARGDDIEQRPLEQTTGKSTA